MRQPRASLSLIDSEALVVFVAKIDGLSSSSLAIN